MTPATAGAVLGWCALHFAIGLAGTALAIRYARRRNLFDQPGERRSHSIATPRGGGIAIVAALLLACIVLAWRTGWAQWLPVACGLFLVAAIGWLDDHRPMSPWPRLAVHVVSAALLAVAAWGGGADAAHVAIAFVLAVALTNIWNFMDGINGIAATQAILAAAGIVVLAGGPPAPVAWLALALLAATAGFLPFNFPVARIFLGDVGSGALGYALAALVALLSRQDFGSTALALLPLSAFAIDATLTLASRIVRGERWWTPHVQHAYQRLARRSGRHGPVVLGYAAWTVAALLLAALLRRSGLPTIMGACCAWYLVGAGIWRYTRCDRELAVTTGSRE